MVHLVPGSSSSSLVEKAEGRANKLGSRPASLVGCGSEGGRGGRTKPARPPSRRLDPPSRGAVRDRFLVVWEKQCWCLNR